MFGLYGNMGSGLEETAPECMYQLTWLTADTYPRGFLQESVNRTRPACHLD